MVQENILSNFEFNSSTLPEDTNELCAKINGVETLSAFQKTSIGLIWEHLKFGTLPVFNYPNDLYLWSPTGSGKTLAFALPIMSYLRSQTIRGLLRVIVLAPSEQLVRQLANVFRCLASGSDCKICTADEVLNKDAVSHFDPCVLITTVGLISALTRSKLNFQHLRFLVLDEADRVLGNSEPQLLLSSCKFQNPPKNPFEWSSKIPPLQKIMVSATLDLIGTSTASLQCYEPLLVKAESNGNISTCYLFSRIGLPNDPIVPNSLKEYFVCCSFESIKPLALMQILENQNIELLPALVFTDSRKEAYNLNELSKILCPSKQSVFHLCTGDKNHRSEQIPNNTNVNDIFICSDLMARGLDTCTVKCVIQYNAPKHLTTYVHRVGRTARAGRTGIALTLVTKGEELKRLKKMRGNLEQIQIDESTMDVNKLQLALQEITKRKK